MTARSTATRRLRPAMGGRSVVSPSPSCSLGRSSSLGSSSGPACAAVRRPGPVAGSLSSTSSTRMRRDSGTSARRLSAARTATPTRACRSGCDRRWSHNNPRRFPRSSRRLRRPWHRHRSHRPSSRRSYRSQTTSRAAGRTAPSLGPTVRSTRTCRTGSGTTSTSRTSEPKAAPAPASSAACSAAPTRPRLSSPLPLLALPRHGGREREEDMRGSHSHTRQRPPSHLSGDSRSGAGLYSRFASSTVRQDFF